MAIELLKVIIGEGKEKKRRVQGREKIDKQKGRVKEREEEIEAERREKSGRWGLGFYIYHSLKSDISILSHHLLVYL